MSCHTRTPARGHVILSRGRNLLPCYLVFLFFLFILILLWCNSDLGAAERLLCRADPGCLGSFPFDLFVFCLVRGI